MARKKRAKSSGAGKDRPRLLGRCARAVAERRAALGRGTLAAALVLLPPMAIALGLWGARRYVLEHPEREHVGARVRLVDAPDWLPPMLRRAIVADLTPPVGADLRDPGLAERVYQRAEDNPWLREVRFVRKSRDAENSGGVLEVHAAYRAPAARVLAADGRRCAYVSHDSHRLNDTVPRWRARLQIDGALHEAYFTGHEHVPAGARDASRVHYFLLRGVEAEPPPPGEPWAGEDLAAGLRMVELLWDRPYRAQIAEIDVRNFRGRASRDEPQLRLVARDRWGNRTEILFGRFPHPDGDWVVSPAEKMAKLDAYADAHAGRLAGIDAQVDLRRHGRLVVSAYSEQQRRSQAARRRAARHQTDRVAPLSHRSAP
ncbi:MAG: hypothetical protein KGY99_07310 [Phycisphaerae bacterium]|nr:hypothetical protein [Phycisphaerae bacterium]